MNHTDAHREFERKILAAVGLEKVPVKSVTISIAAGMTPEIHITACLRNEERIADLGRAISEMRYRPVATPTTRTEADASSAQTNADGQKPEA